MKKTGSCSITVFCTTDELIEWMRMLCNKWELLCVDFRASVISGDIKSPDKVLIENDSYKAFLLPKSDTRAKMLDMNDVKSREWGWVDVHPGKLITRDSHEVLLLSSIRAENFDSESVHPVRFIQWLKREIRARHEITFGVTGRNVVTNKTSGYRDIGFTSNALALFRSGAVWKQFADDRGVFEPGYTERLKP